MGDMIFRKIFILGAGAIGSTCGAKLSKKNDVTLIGEQRHVEAINSKGLVVKGEMKGVIKIKADTQVRDVPPDTLIILTTKVHDSKKALEGVVKLLRKDTTILILQNGIGNEELVKSVVDDRCGIERGVVHFGADFLKPGEVTIGPGWATLGNSEKSRRIADLFNESGIETRVIDDLRVDIWKKLIMNCVLNPLSAVLGARDYEIAVPVLEELRERVVRECVKVARAEGMEFDEGLRAEIDRDLLRWKNYASMYQDLMKGRKTEIDFLNGKIVELGRKHGIKTPVNETLVALIKFLEKKSGN